MRRLLAVLPALLLLSVSAASAQTDDEVMTGLDTALFCATAFAMATQAPGQTEDKLAHYNAASEQLFALAYSTMTESGLDEAKIDEVAAAYSDEVAAAITSGETMRFSEEACDAAVEAIGE